MSINTSERTINTVTTIIDVRSMIASVDDIDTVSADPELNYADPTDIQDSAYNAAMHGLITGSILAGVVLGEDAQGRYLIRGYECIVAPLDFVVDGSLIPKIWFTDQDDIEVRDGTYYARFEHLTEEKRSQILSVPVIVTTMKLDRNSSEARSLIFGFN